MSLFFEIEKRYQLLNREITPCKKGFEWVSREHVLDHYFDTPDGHYYQEGIFIRVRNGKTLDIKFNPDHLGKSEDTDHVQCHEYSFNEPFQAKEFENFVHLKSLIKTQLPQGQDFASFFSENGLVPLLTIDKERTTYKRDAFLLVLDDIKGLDPILEVEYAGEADGKNTQDIVRKIDKMMEGWPLRSLKSGSFEMLLRSENFDLYKKGKYLLEKDLSPKTAA